ncbi:alginate lyase family protein [Carboxydocella thermautotrophica]|nr:alginate lyase family protein [Carboxydocella thermautotrophica]
MNNKEILQRLQRELKKAKYRKNIFKQKYLKLPRFVTKHNDLWKNNFQINDNNIRTELNSLLFESNLYLGTIYNFLNKGYYTAKIDWNYDDINFKNAPLEFAFDINYKDFNIVGDIKNIWEKNRHQHLSLVAVAYKCTKDNKYAEYIKDQLISWVEQNPILYGVNWASPLELGIRLISWVWIERLLRDWNGYDQLFGSKGLMWEPIYWHQKIISDFYSIGSSANNHLIGEMAGLYISSTVWPIFKESEEWRKLSADILEREIELQFFDSGLNKEQAFSYHLFVIEFLLLAAIEGDRFGKPFSNKYKLKLRKAIEIIPFLIDTGNNLPNYGDSDEGLAILLHPKKFPRINWIFWIANMWLSSDLPVSNEQGLLTARIIYPEGCVSIAKLSNICSKDVKFHIFEDAGLYIFTQNRYSEKEIFCTFDAGPIGYLSLAAHGHADALSFTLSVGGLPVIIDPGTYQYNVDLYWRNYFRGTKAHNTINIDDLDQSVSGGPFLWTKKANVQVLNWTELPNGASITAQHDGYLRLPGRIIHQRTFTLDNNKIEIIDRVLGNGNHKVEWRLHFSPHCKAEIIDNQCLVSWNNGKLIIDLDTRLNWLLEYGGTNAGWYSEGFNLKQPIYTLIGYQNSMLPLEIGCRIKVINSGTSTDNSIGKYD